DLQHSESDITPQIWVRLAVRVNELLAKPEIVGIVVTHGTNTLEETAYFLDLTTTSPKPVILVGAQRPASDPDSDGPRNLLDATRVAVASDAVRKGVMVVMNGQINARGTSQKQTLAKWKHSAVWNLARLESSTWKRSVFIALRSGGRPS